MKLRSVCIFAFMQLVFLDIKAQFICPDSSASQCIRNMEIPVQKVYLHLDRSFYTAGDNIWFKAYLVDNSTLALSDSIETLNVELISPENKIINRLIIKMDKGTGTGDFNLQDSVSSGYYVIRAYTNWMRNFGDIFFFKKGIVIVNPLKFKTLNLTKPEENQKKFDVQFFPEGGRLIENVKTRVGFKAIDSYGHGCNVKGRVVSSLGDSVASFSTTHLGMGSFDFISMKGLEYFAEGVSADRIPFKVKLPDPMKNGYTMNVSNIDKDYICVSINTNQETLDQLPLQEMIVAGHVRNLLCANVHLGIKGLTNQVYLSKTDFPEGITRITLMDINGIIYCERVCYVESRQKYKIQISPDKPEYGLRQKVCMDICVKDTSGIPVSTNLSISVVDANQVEGLDKKSDIHSYLLLESEIMGNIEQPFYYFDTTCFDRYNALDNLLLTQGWRNYIWKYLSDTIIKLDSKHKNGISLSGNVFHKLSGKPFAGTTISLALSAQDTSIYCTTTTDIYGRYSFEGLNFTGSANILVSASDEKSQRQGRLVHDSIQNDIAPIDSKWVIKPETNLEEENAFNKENEQKLNILKKYPVTDTIVLDEVIVKARKLQKENSDGHNRVYGNADFSLTVTDNMFARSDILQVLQNRVAGLIIIEDPEKGYRVFFRSSDYYQKFGDASPLFLVDGKETDLQNIISIPVSAVDKVEVLKGGKTTLYGFHGSFGVINVLTKQGIVNPWEPVLYSINKQVNGYYQSRTFYEPKYKIHKPGDEKPDVRTTLYWHPDVSTHANGYDSVSFYTSDSNSDVIVDVEGITESGVPVTGRIILRVK